MTTAIIGVDCATQAAKVGAALASFLGGQLSLLDVASRSTHADLIALLKNWIEHCPRVLLALDAPLGWPDALSRALIHHGAGKPILESPDSLFQRLTDHIVDETCNQRPLDVGADRIARTAHAALQLLGDLSTALGQDVPLAWSAQFPERVAAIEVYPAATLKARDIQSSQYKKKGLEDEKARRGIVESLSQHLMFQVDGSRLHTNPDVLDATICALAGADFLRGEVIPPTDLRLAHREGWIWVKPPSAGLRQASSTRASADRAATTTMINVEDTK